MLIFAHPWLWFFLPLPYLVRLLPASSNKAQAVWVPFGARLQQAMASNPTQQVKSQFKWLTPILIWVCAVAALCRPQWIGDPVEKIIPTRDLLLLVDLSGSMDQEDFNNASGEKVDRLSAVKEIVGDFVIKRKGDRVGLVVFGDSPFLQAPFSTDLALSRRLLDESAVGMAGPRTALGDAIGLGIHLFDESNAPAKTIIALTDGNDTKSQVPPIEAARIAAQRDIRIHTVAIGDPGTVEEDKLDLDSLEQVAQNTNGQFYFAANREELEGIYHELDQVETRKIRTVSHRPKLDLFHLPLSLLICISLGSKWRITRFRREPVQIHRSLRVDPRTGQLLTTP
ncbi:VWA domain-containing protein [Luteolibacter pohnpeiensis]|uniref:VWA domain-containing protein n=2 Tax=Luteolibacter pohnpeiensis TaxID=454153 RepID=A0A934S8S0_9BACT|nr:VWA domain-containing protein [Luteolibacter pohnpeiensis]